MLLGTIFVMAKQYSEHLAKSVDRRNKRAIEDGEFIGKFKHGYTVDINRAFQPDPRNFTKVKHMFSMAAEGKSQKQIREWLNERSKSALAANTSLINGIKTMSQSSSETRTTPVSINGVRTLLT